MQKVGNGVAIIKNKAHLVFFNNAKRKNYYKL